MSNPQILPPFANEPDPSSRENPTQPRSRVARAAYEGPSEIYLAPVRDPAPNHLAARFVRWYGLDVYGTGHLSRRALLDMYGVAGILTVIFLFDFGAWSLLFNMIVHAGMMEFSSISSVAIFAGLVFATATLIYERQFMTSDTSSAAGRERRRIKWAVLIRVIVLVAAATVTSQSMELLVFHGSIQDRVHEEAVWLEALKSANAWKDANQELKPLTQQQIDEKAQFVAPTAKVDYTNATNARDKAETDLETAKKKLETAQNGRDQASNKVLNSQASIKKLRNDVENAGDEDTRKKKQEALQKELNHKIDLDSQLEKAKGKVNRATSDKNDAETQLKNADTKFEGAKGEYNTAVAKVGEEKKTSDEKSKLDARRERDWISKIRTASAATTVYEFGDTAATNHRDTLIGREWNDPGRHIFEKLRIIDDLCKGRPPFYREAPPEIRQVIAEHFGLGDFGTADAAARDRRILEGKNFRFTYWCVFSIAMVIPMLIFALKFLIAPELKHYYSTAYQEAAGNPEAGAHMQAVREIEERGKSTSAGL